MLVLSQPSSPQLALPPLVPPPLCRYSTEVAELENTFVHLTNVAVQKQSAAYNSERGNKWSLDDLQLHLESIRGHAATEGLFSDIRVRERNPGVLLCRCA